MPLLDLEPKPELEAQHHAMMLRLMMRLPRLVDGQAFWYLTLLLEPAKELPLSATVMKVTVVLAAMMSIRNVVTGHCSCRNAE